MDDIGNIGYILFFVFLLIINAIASANRKKQKQRRQQQQQQRPQQQQPEDTGGRTKSLEEVMREIFGETTPKPEAPPRPREVLPPQPAEATVRKRTTSEEAEAMEMRDIQEKYANPLQEVMMRSISDPAAAARRKADQEQLQKIFAQRPEPLQPRHVHINARQAVIYSEILMKPRWKEY
jgi:hypothetical protein